MTAAARRSVYKPRGPKALSGAVMPYGWNLVRHDTFGTGGSVPDHATLHKLYLEGAFWDTNPDGTQLNNPINSQQQSYQSFESGIAFSADHLTIQGRGTGTTTVTSAQMVSRWMDRSFIFEAKFQTPNVAGTWLEFWAYPAITTADTSELDVEVVQSASGGPETVNEVFFANHGDTATNINIIDPATFDSVWMRYIGAGYDASATTHYYTIYYDDTTGTIRRYLDGKLQYTADWKWMQSLGGTGFGPDANCLIDLAIGGSWPGNVSDLSTWTGDLNIYSMSYYTKRPSPPTTQAWNQGHMAAGIRLSDDYLTATKYLPDTNDKSIFASIPKSSGKWYWEVVLHGIASGMVVGIGTDTASTWDGRWVGEDPNTLCWIAGNGNVVVNVATVANWGSFDTSVAGGVRVCLALDADNHKLWGRVGATGNWCNDVLANQNPASNVGGTALGTALQTNIVPAVGMKSNTTPDSAVGVFALADLAGTPPAGFSVFPVGEVWDQQHKTTLIQLSADALTATNSSGGNDALVYSTPAKSAGKYYWEAVITTTDTSHVGVGLGTSSGAVGAGTYLGQNSDMVSWFPSGTVFNNSGSVGTWATYASGDRLCFALDLDNNKIWARNGATGNWNNDVIANQNPATGAGGYALPSTVQTNVCAAAQLHTAGDQVVGYFDPASWLGTPPAGFSLFA